MYLAQALDELMAETKGTTGYAAAWARLRSLKFSEIPQGPATRHLNKRLQSACPK